MNTEYQQILYWAHMLDESMISEGNESLISDLESAFGDLVWRRQNDFIPNNLHLKQMFRIIIEAGNH